MSKKVDYAKLKALSQQIIECIGDDSEGENPSLGKQDNALDDGGQEPVDDMEPAAEDSGFADKSTGDDQETKKKKKDSALAMMGSVLASKLGK